MASPISGIRTGKAISRDGTVIAYEKTGQGPPIVLVDGATCYRASGPMRPLAALLSQHFTVYAYDRRGRGESSNTLPYAVEREVEDLDALINVAGGSAFVFGISSGAALAIEGARHELAIRKLALFEPPFILDDSRRPVTDEYLAQLDAYVAADRRGDAVRHFMKAVGVPGFVIAMMRFMPAWSKLKGVAHTIPYDFAILRDNQRGRPLSSSWASITVPTLAIDGGNSPAWMRTAVRSVADMLPNAEYRTLPGQTHMVNAKVLAPALAEFFNAAEAAVVLGQPSMRSV
jgi:pimeloyl-ACP methyl ester carboxylesterase